MHALFATSRRYPSGQAVVGVLVGISEGGDIGVGAGVGGDVGAGVGGDVGADVGGHVHVSEHSLETWPVGQG